MSLAIALNVLVLPAVTANAYTRDIATLIVNYYTPSWASASTNSYGYVNVSLSINTSDGYGNATGSSGHASVGVGLDATTGTAIIKATSYHSDPDVRMSGYWEFSGGYSIYYI